MRRVGSDLDRHVQGASGAAHVRFAHLVDDATLVIEARIAGARGTLELRVRPHAESEAPPLSDRGAGALSSNLGLARPYRGATITVAAEVKSLGSDLVGLCVELAQPDPAGADRAPLSRDTYSVESRVEDGRARLELVIDLG